jgi:hypothetical protein
VSPKLEAQPQTLQNRTPLQPVRPRTAWRTPPRRRRTLPILARVVLAGVLVTGATGISAVFMNVLGAGERFENLVNRIELALNPPPVRPTRETVAVTPRPIAAAGSQAPTRPVSGGRTHENVPPTPSPTPARRPVDVKIAANPQKVFAHQLTKDWCAVAGTQIVLATLGLADTSDTFQRKLASRIGEWESWQDSHNGDWGPAAIAEALAEYGAPDYEIRAYETRSDALRGAAVSLSTTGKPVVLIAWRGAHTWIMNGYRANADPTIFDDATVTGTYVLDPWYPWVSSIWGPSDAPGTFQDAAEMTRNFLPWKRPEGKYPDRDGKFIILVPTKPLAR